MNDAVEELFNGLAIMGVAAASAVVCLFILAWLFARRPRKDPPFVEVKPVRLPGFEGFTGEVQRHIHGEPDTGMISARNQLAIARAQADPDGLTCRGNRPTWDQMSKAGELMKPVDHLDEPLGGSLRDVPRSHRRRS